MHRRRRDDENNSVMSELRNSEMRSPGKQQPWFTSPDAPFYESELALQTLNALSAQHEILSKKGKTDGEPSVNNVQESCGFATCPCAYFRPQLCFNEPSAIPCLLDCPYMIVKAISHRIELTKKLQEIESARLTHWSARRMRRVQAALQEEVEKRSLNLFRAHWTVTQIVTIRSQCSCVQSQQRSISPNCNKVTTSHRCASCQERQRIALNKNDPSKDADNVATVMQGSEETVAGAGASKRGTATKRKRDEILTSRTSDGNSGSGSGMSNSGGSDSSSRKFKYKGGDYSTSTSSRLTGSSENGWSGSGSGGRSGTGSNTSGSNSSDNGATSTDRRRSGAKRPNTSRESNSSSDGNTNGKSTNQSTKSNTGQSNKRSNLTGNSSKSSDSSDSTSRRSRTTGSGSNASGSNGSGSSDNSDDGEKQSVLLRNRLEKTSGGQLQHDDSVNNYDTAWTATNHLFTEDPASRHGESCTDIHKVTKYNGTVDVDGLGIEYHFEYSTYISRLSNSLISKSRCFFCIYDEINTDQRSIVDIATLPNSQAVALERYVKNLAVVANLEKFISNCGDKLADQAIAIRAKVASMHNALLFRDVQKMQATFLCSQQDILKMLHDAKIPTNRLEADLRAISATQ